MDIKTKHGIGDTVWFLNENKVMSGEIIGIFVNVFSYEGKVTHSESYTAKVPTGGLEVSYISNAFPTKQALIDFLSK